MLSTAKIPLEQKIQQILYKAYAAQYNPDPSMNSCDVSAKASVDEAAKKFAQTAAGPATEAIYKFVKEIGINIIISPTLIAPPLPPVLPGGPCTGAIPMNNVIVT